jgi:3-oxoacyl-[acyl-carrier-protein] synthase-1
MITAWIRITQESVLLNGQPVTHQATGIGLLTELYRNRINDYLKFFKMDVLCKLGFVASEMLLYSETGERFVPREDRAIVLFNRSGSLHADRNFQQTIQDPENYFPSPSIFVYTLPNIVTGEIALRNKYYGETSFYVLEQLNPVVMAQHIGNAFLDTTTTSVIGGWMDCEDEENFEALLFIADNQCHSVSSLSEKIELLNKLNR